MLLRHGCDPSRSINVNAATPALTPIQINGLSSVTTNGPQWIIFTGHLNVGLFMPRKIN